MSVAALGRRVLVLREASDGQRTAAELRRRGHEPMLLPLARIVALRTPCPPGPFGAVLVTSAQAVPWLRDRRARIGDVPAFAVGARTAEALENAGWPVARRGTEGAADLAEPLAALLAGGSAPLLYAAGRVRLPATEEGLARRGVPLVVAEAYDTVSREPEPGEIARLVAEPVEAALLLSALQAEGFARLWDAHRHAFAGEELRLLCLSERIADRLPASLRERAVQASSPRLADLLDLLDAGRHRSAEDFRCRERDAL